MIPALDTWRSANVMVKQRGEDTAQNAAVRADELLAAGDTEGYMVWQLLRPLYERFDFYERPGDLKRFRAPRLIVKRDSFVMNLPIRQEAGWGRPVTDC